MPGLVALVVNKLKVPADRVWEMTLADICLTLSDPQKDKEAATTKLGQQMACLDAQRKWEIRKEMTDEDWIELAEWKQRLM